MTRAHLTKHPLRHRCRTPCVYILIYAKNKVEGKIFFIIILLELRNSQYDRLNNHQQPCIFHKLNTEHLL